MQINATLKQIEVFLAVARNLSFSRAAALLHMSQPALSATIGKLESELGARLFDRTSRNVVLTPVGAEFVPVAERLVDQFEAAMRQMRAFIDGRHGRLSIAASPSVMATLLPAALAIFREANRNIEIALHELLFEQCIGALRAGEAEVALTPQKIDAADLQQRELFEDYLVVLCSEDHPIARQRAVSWSQLLEHEQVAMKHASSVRQLAEAEYRRHGATLRPTYEVDRVSSMIGFVAAGLGVGMVPYSLVQMRALGGVTYRPLTEGTAKRTICATTLRSQSPSPAAAAFIEICLELAQRKLHRRG